jgi:hypothetical protein
LEFEDEAFDRVPAIHVLEHLANLPAALREISGVMRKSVRFSVVFPCVGGWAYSLGRRVTTQRTFEKRYRMPYGWMIRYEHINKAQEVVDELKKVFRVVDRTFYPIGQPSVNLNVVIIGMTLSFLD